MTNETTNSFDGLSVIVKAGGEYGTTVLNIADAARVRAIFSLLAAMDAVDAAQVEMKNEAADAIDTLEQLRQKITGIGDATTTLGKASGAV